MKEINMKKLSEEFNIVDVDSEDIKENTTDKKDNESDNDNSASVEKPDRIIEINIDKANKVLDAIMKEIDDGHVTARMGEVAGQLVNAVTNAVDKIYNKSFGLENLLLKDKMVRLKDKELDIKQRIKDDKPRESNLIITDRESIMRIINDSKKEKENDE